MSADVSMERFKVFWDEEVRQKGKDASILWTFLRCYWDEIVWAEFIVTMSVFFTMLGPSYLINRLITYNAAPQADLGIGLPLAFGILISESFRSIFINQYWFLSMRVACKMRSLILCKFLIQASAHSQITGIRSGLCQSSAAERPVRILGWRAGQHLH